MPITEVEHLQKRYGDTVAVRDVSSSIEKGRKGEIFAILGPNGVTRVLQRPDAPTSTGAYQPQNSVNPQNFDGQKCAELSPISRTSAAGYNAPTESERPLG